MKRREMYRNVLMAASVASMIQQFNLDNLVLLQELGYKVHVACNFKEGNTCSVFQVRKLLQFFRGRGIVWHQWDCPRSIRPFGSCVRAYRQIRGLLRRYPFAWMHCHSPIGGVLARIAAHEAGVAVIYTAHGFHFYQGAPLQNWMLYYPAEKWLSCWTDVLITVNREDELLAKRCFYAGKVCRIPGVGVDTGKYWRPGLAEGKEARGSRDLEFCRRFRIPEHALVLLSVGELNKGKNHRMVMDALAALADGDVYYLICGQGGLRQDLLRYADSLGVRGRVRMPGFVEDLRWIYWNADIFVFPSVREGMPVALMEAMAAGLPCVVSDIRGCRELLGSKDASGRQALYQVPGGFRFSLKHPEQLVQALQMVADQETLRLSCGAYNAYWIKNYGRDLVQKKMKEIYADMAVTSNRSQGRQERYQTTVQKGGRKGIQPADRTVQKGGRKGIQLADREWERGKGDGSKK